MPQKVLLIESDETVRQDFAQVLRNHGFQISTAKDGPTGVKVLKHSLPDLVITNMVLGDMTAVEVCEKVRAMPGGAAIGIILVSNSQRSQKYMDGIREKYNVLQFLQKPFSGNDLLQVAREFLEKKILPGKTFDQNPSAVDGKDTDERLAKATNPLRGDLQDSAMPYFPGKLLFHVHQKSTGVFHLKKDGLQKNIFMLKGTLVGVESKIKEELLGPVLVEKGVIGHEEYLNAARLMVEESMQLGEALVKMGAIDAGVLDELIIEHQVHKIATCFLWLDATVEFVALSKTPLLQNEQNLQLQSVFQQGFDQIQRIKNLPGVLQPLAEAFGAKSPRFAQYRHLIPMEEKDLSFIERFERGYNFSEVANEKTERQIAFLYICGLLVQTEPTPEMLVARIQDLKKAGGGKDLTAEFQTKIKKLNDEHRAELEKLQKEKEKLATALEERKASTETLRQKLKDLEEKKADDATAKGGKSEELENELRKLKAEFEASKKSARSLEKDLERAAVQESPFGDPADMPDLEPLAPLAPAPGDFGNPAPLAFGEDDILESLETPGLETPETDPFPTPPAQKPDSTTGAPDAFGDGLDALDSGNDIFDLSSDLAALEEAPNQAAPLDDQTMVFAPAQRPTPDSLGNSLPDPFASGGEFAAAASPEADTGGIDDFFATPAPPPASPASASKPGNGQDPGHDETGEVGLAAMDGGTDIFDFAGDLGSLESPSAPQTPAEATVVMPAKNLDSGPPPNGGDQKLFGEDLGADFDDAFGQTLEEGIKKPPEKLPATAPNSQPAPAAGLMVDPFAPQALAQATPEDSLFDEFFGAPEKSSS